MKKRMFAFLFAAAFTAGQGFAQSKNIIQAYIEKFKDIAIEEMQRTGVPASITLAQGIHETGAGTSDLVTRSNNHFGIKCKTEWQGERVYHDDDARGECFRKYDDPIISYRDHSDFLRNRAHYASLFTLDPTDYEAWAHGLKKAGYATNPKYPQILIKLIRDYNLQEYTLIALGRKQPDANEPQWVKNTESANMAMDAPSVSQPENKKIYPEGTFEINNTKVVYVPKGVSYLKLADDYNVSVSRLLDFNDLKDGDVTTDDGLLFLQRKRKTGENEFHVVMPGETLYSISQAEGIRMGSLLEYNFLTPNVQPAVGEKLYLKAAAPAMPKLANEKSGIVTASFKSEPLGTPAKQTELNSITHTVQPKETLYSIAKKYEVAVDDVKKWNAMESNELKIGQQIRINKSR